jgi:dephospho-CoA kinase
MTSKKSAKIVIGLTGSFGTGKTTVAGIFKSLGADVIDADLLAHEALSKNSSAYKKVVALFGPSVLGAGGHIDRRALAGVVFKDKRLLNKLCGIVHPLVIARIRRLFRAATCGRVIVVDAPLLIESGLHRIVDKLVVVSAPRRDQIARCAAKFGLTEKEVLERIKNQMPLGKKIKMADYVICNDGTKNETKREVSNVWRDLWR